MSERVCRNCGGSGQVVVSPPLGSCDGPQYGPCPVCHGTGMLPVGTQVGPEKDAVADIMRQIATLGEVARQATEPTRGVLVTNLYILKQKVQYLSDLITG